MKLEDFSNSIACIGWGSLIWQPKELPVSSQWFHDGPILPVEFARHSGQNTGEDKLSLVLLREATLITTRWAILEVPDIKEARNALRSREGCGIADIGSSDISSGEFAHTISLWAKSKGLRGVVWTALPAKFADEIHRVPSVDEAIHFLRSLSAKASRIAEEYVRMAPLIVRTPYRAAFEESLGWSPLAVD